MKRTLKIVSLLLALLCCTSVIAACTGEGNPTGTVGGTTVGTIAPAPKYDLITIAEALVLCGEPGNLTTERYYIQGEVVSITNAAYGQMVIKDATGSIEVYGTFSADGEKTFPEIEDKPQKGDTVILHCTLQNYNGTKEVKNARLIEVEHAVFSPDGYTNASIAQARDAEEGAKLIVSGVVARITYANGKVPCGVYLVDNTQAIYIYDAGFAGSVSIGDKATVAGSKAYWILDTEQSNAEKFGYKGCCQLDNVHMISHETGTNDFDKSWIPTSTVKAILDTPVTENITSTIYKVNALVQKKEEPGFTNYYIYDLDGTTGAYVYTQCNGGDFAWLDAFDGKICTVYLSPLNAKSTASDCYFRFIPVSVIDESFTFDLANTAQHVVEYYGIPQFSASYTGDPAIEMNSVVSSSLLKFENATLSYTSDNTEVVFFTTEGDKTVFHCNKPGIAKITITATYNGKSHSADVTVSVFENKEYETISIENAIKATEDTVVTVRGIVGPSVVNKSGFYLFDETGMISVIVKDAATFGTIKIGDEIVLTGKREAYKDAGKTHAGQTCLVDAQVLANYYGKNQYPTDKFITDKTVTDLYGYSINDDYTTNVYQIKATVVLEKSQFYTNLYLSDGNKQIRAYSSNAANQYKFLMDYENQEVILEIALCNWNNGKYYTCCVLAVHAPDGTVIYNTLNFNS